MTSSQDQQYETPLKFPNAYTYLKQSLKCEPGMQFLIDVLECEILNKDAIGKMTSIFHGVKYVDSLHNIHNFTGTEMVYFLENFMIPDNMSSIATTRQTWPLNLFFQEQEHEDDYTLHIYTENDIIIYEGKPGRHDFVVVSRNP